MDLILEILRQTGLAALAGISIYVAYRKDKQNAALYDRLEAKSDRFVRKYYKLSSHLNSTVEALLKQLGMQPVPAGPRDDEEE